MRGPRTSALGFAIAALLALPVVQMADAQARRAPSPQHQRAPAPPPGAHAPRPAPPHPLPPPPRPLPRRNEIPPSRLLGPRVYHFPPIDAHISFYYHPYFGFYYGPYYGPFYPYAGPYRWPDHYMSGAIRTKVSPRETEVYVNGYFAGVVDDFDGVFQRLYLPAGEYTITLRLAGYASFSRDVLVRRGDTLDISHTMLRLRPGQTEMAPPAVSAVPEVLPDPPGPDATQPASPYGMLALRVTPADAQVTVDGQAWTAISGLPEIVVHLAAGWHQIDVRKNGYQPFSTRVELTQGQTTRLAVSLAP